MLKSAIWIGVVAALFAGSLQLSNSATRAGDDSVYGEMSCNQLWYERNEVFAARGFCFKTQRAIRVFGTRCYAPFGKLRASDRRKVNLIRRIERRKGC